MNANGFPFVYPMLMSLLIYGGSLEFVAVEMLLSPFAPMQVFIMTLLIQARHIFYGISMLDRSKGMGWKKFYLIFGMCDETFSVNYTADIPEDVDRGWFMFFVTLLNKLYWVSGATVGGLVGSLLRFDTTGISFVMTAMFVVIFLEQWLKEDNHISSLVGVAAAGGMPNLLWHGLVHASDHGCDRVTARGVEEKIRSNGGSEMTVWQQVITIGLCVAGTMLTRFLPFLIFKEDRKTPGFVQYIGKYLPSAVFGMLVVYCLKNVDVLEGNHGLPELIAILVTGALHVWKRQMLLSIAGGTVCYMLLVRFVF